jgi:hypothetical protein
MRGRPFCPRSRPRLSWCFLPNANDSRLLSARASRSPTLALSVSGAGMQAKLNATAGRGTSLSAAPNQLAGATSDDPYVLIASQDRGAVTTSMAIAALIDRVGQPRSAVGAPEARSCSAGGFLSPIRQIAPASLSWLRKAPSGEYASIRQDMRFRVSARTSRTVSAKISSASWFEASILPSSDATM